MLGRMIVILLLMAAEQPKTLRAIAERIGDQYPASVPAPPAAIALREALPETVGTLTRAAQGYYGVSLLPSLLGARTKRYVECGVEEAVVARYKSGDTEEHALILRSSR